MCYSIEVLLFFKEEKLFFVFFFFQAEDGIRDLIVTGLQTCALPILLAAAGLAQAATGQWSSTGPPAAPIRAVATDPLSLGTVYAGANGPRMFKSTNGGESWT